MSPYSTSRTVRSVADIIPFGPGGLDAWVSRFRTNPAPGPCLQACSESGNVSLSGIGLYDDPSGSIFVVPRSLSKTYEDLLSGELPRLEVDDIDYGDEDPGVWGFVFHDACWELLNALYGQEYVPLDRLHSTLRSLPSPAGILGQSWGHIRRPLHARRRGRNAMELLHVQPLGAWRE